MKRMIRFFHLLPHWRFSIALLLFCCYVQIHPFAQGFCPGSADCASAQPICLQDMDGMTCNNLGGGGSICKPFCSQNFIGSATTIWWCFIAPGGMATITLTTGNCIDADHDNDRDGIMWAIWADCTCGKEIYCGDKIHHEEPNKTWTYTGMFEACKKYYISMGSIENDICDFTIAVSIDDLVIPERTGKPRTVCYGSTWYSNTITAPGSYRARFPNNCCPFDSVVTFDIPPDPIPPDVYYITCDNTPYVDFLKHSHKPCTDQLLVPLPKTSNPWKCDSSILLTSVNVNVAPKWRTQCYGGMVEISPNITVLKACNVGETYQFEYRWYMKNDPKHTTISSEERLLVEAISKDYCVEVSVEVALGTETAVCVNTFCETINESDFAPKCFPLAGDLLLCEGQLGSYWIDTVIQQKILFHTWTIDGGTVISKVDSSGVFVKWNLPAGDTGTVCVYYDTDCGRSCEKCLKVAIKKSPKPDAGPRDSICDLATHFNGKKDAGGSWSLLTGPAGAKVNIDHLNDPKSNVSVDQFGNYWFAYNESYLGCAGADTVELSFNPGPDSSQLSYLCNSKATQYNFQFLINNGTPPYKIIKGNGIIDTNNYFNSNLCDNLTKYSILIRDAKGCELSFDFNHDCKCLNAIGQIDRTPDNLCEDQFFICNYDSTLQILDKNDTLIYVISNNPDPLLAAQGKFIKMLNSAKVVFDASFMNYNNSYYIFVLIGKKNGKGGVDFKGGCVQTDGPKPVQFFKIPSPYAGANDSICGTSIQLKGIRSLPDSKIKWRLVSGNGISIANDTIVSSLINSNGKFGTFIFELTEENKICSTSDSVTVTFNQSPFISVDEKICLNYVPPYPYQANVRITQGQAPFTLLSGNGTINGNIYTTEILSSLASFQVQIKDANGCISNLIVDTYNCNCGIIDAGKLDTNLIEVCLDQCVSIRSLIPETLEPKDIAMYVLHQSSYNDKAILPIDTFYSASDKICFNPAKGMQAGKTYYITRIVGNDTMPKDKIVDFSDPCLRASNNQAIIWNAYPLVNAGPADSVCFYNYQLHGTSNSGMPNWSFISGPGQAVINSPDNLITDVLVTNPGSYSYLLTDDYKGCISKDTVVITHWDAPDFINAQPPVCDNTAEYFKVKIDAEHGDRSSWIIDGFTPLRGSLSGSFIAANTWQTDWIANNEMYRLIINDRHNCLPDTIQGTYVCPCINSIGTLDKTPIVLCLDGLAQANYNINSGTPDGNDVIRFMLFDGNPVDPLSAAVFYFSNNGNFSFDKTWMQTGKTYYIAVFMGNPDPNDPKKILLTDRCLKFDVVPVTWYNYPAAKITGEDTLTCLKRNLVLDGSSSTSGSGAPVNYTWSTANGIIQGTTTNATADITAPGTYKLVVTDLVSNCSNEISFDVGIRIDNPVVQIANPLQLTCDRTNVMLDGSSSSQGNEFNIQWKGPGNINNANTYQPLVDATGNYQLIILNQKNGCLDSASVLVTGDYQKPIPDIRQIGVLACANRKVQLDGGNSKGNSGNALSYSWQTYNGNIVSGFHSSTITVDKPGIYQLMVKDQNNGCDSLTNYEVVEIFNPITGMIVNAKNPKCFGDQNGEIELKGVYSNTSVNGLQYSINGLSFSNSNYFPNLSQGPYHLKVRDNNGCEHDTILQLTEPGKMKIQVIKSIVVDLNSPVELERMILNISGGTPIYQDTTWFNTNQNINWPDEHYLADTTRNFIITAIDAVGCQVQDTVTVIVRIIKDVWWPTAFSPNDDGINDLWNLKGKRVNIIHTLNIYNRWGEMVYSIHEIKDGNQDPNAGWNGKWKGQRALPGVYVFYAEIEYTGSTEYNKYSGEFTLIR